MGGNAGTDKVRTPAESIEATAWHLSLEKVAHGMKGTIMLGEGEKKKHQEMKKKAVEGQRFGEKSPTWTISGSRPELRLRLLLSRSCAHNIQSPWDIHKQLHKQ